MARCDGDGKNVRHACGMKYCPTSRAVPRTSQARWSSAELLSFGGLDHIMIMPAAGLERLPAHIILAKFCQARVPSGS